MSLGQMILKLINDHQGIKSVDLVVRLMNEIQPTQFSHHDYARTIHHLVETNEIVEFEYTVPQIPYRVKSIYFPKGTVCGVK